MDKSFLKKTIDLCQPHYEEKLTEEDARVIVENLTGFFDLLAEWEKKEKKPNPQTREATKKAHELAKAK